MKMELKWRDLFERPSSLESLEMRPLRST